MRNWGIPIASFIFGALMLAGCGGGGSAAPQPPVTPPPPPTVTPAPPSTAGHPTFLSPHSKPIAVSGDQVFVVNTPADTLDVIDAVTRTIVARIDVGIDPVGVALRPDGLELWVSNHVSDSVSVIDTDPASPTNLQVIATIQDFDPVTRATRFDEPVGIAFANNSKAYVALSSENQVAVIDVATRQISNRLNINAQDPRAITVRDGRLYVIPFESNNQTQISGCVGPLDGDRCTFDAVQHVITNNNVLSAGIIVDIIRDPQIPDRDLFVFDTSTDQLIQVVSGLGTLLYGVDVDSGGRVFVTQADARNDANGRAGTLQHGLAEMDNRAFFNRITNVDCNAGVCTAPTFTELEPALPAQPATGMALATPFAIRVSEDDQTLVVSAASSDQLFTVDATTGNVLGRATVASVPRGIALVSDGNGAPQDAWVFSAVANSVSLVDVSDPTDPQVTATVALDDPTHAFVKAGRIAFNDAAASTSGTFSCESCHPDGGTDQLVWVLDTPLCSFGTCTQIQPRTTMPIRGLRDTAPYHWDGIPGDPFGGNNTANINGNSPANCNRNDPASCTRFLVDGGLASTMCEVGNCPTNDENKSGALDAIDRDAMANFLLAVPYPPAQRRAYDNVLTQTARNGFQLFHIDGDLQGDPQPNVCGDCHRMPFWVTTNTPGTGMDAPTWRGAWDRWLILPQGRLNIIEFNFFSAIMAQGAPEELVWRLSWASRTRFNPVWNMVTEGSTGFHGAFSRQVTLNQASANSAETTSLLNALEQAAGESAIALQGEGVTIDAGVATPIALQFDAAFQGGVYVQRDGNRDSFTRSELMALATSGEFVGTFTARIGENVDLDNPQPAIWTDSEMHLQTGRQQFPVVSAGVMTMEVRGRHVQPGATVFVDGRRVNGSVSCMIGSLPACSGERVDITLQSLPAAGIHFVQVQNPDGLISNDFIFHRN